MRHQRGLAAVTAILIVAVAASAATLMLAQQSAMLDQTMLIASRAQADQYLRAGLDWCRGVLLEDGATSLFDSLDEGWAQPIAAMPVDRAVVSGAITDEQGKFNLNNLVSVNTPSTPDINAFKAILESQGLAPDLADAVIDWIDGNDDLTSTSGAENPYYLSLKRPYRAGNAPMMQMEELYRVRGFDAAAVRKLRPYVTALVPAASTMQGSPPPQRTKVNINTASAVVLQALLPAIPPQEIVKLVNTRKGKPMKDTASITTWASKYPAADLTALDVKSAYFLARIQVTQDDVELASEALVQRPDKAAPVIIWRRSRY
jgi:general secretion pathway protein K